MEGLEHSRYQAGDDAVSKNVFIRCSASEGLQAHRQPRKRHNGRAGSAAVRMLSAGRKILKRSPCSNC